MIRFAFGNVAFGNVAFGNMVAKTDALHHWATCTSALPKANRRSLGLLLGTQRVMGNSYLRSPKSKQMKSWFTFGYPEGNGQLVPPLSP